MSVYRLNPGADEEPKQFTGMVKEMDPGAVPDFAFTHLENVRLDPMVVRSRAGQAKVNDVAVSGCIEGLFDAGDTGSPE